MYRAAIDRKNARPEPGAFQALTSGTDVRRREREPGTAGTPGRAAAQPGRAGRRQGHGEGRSDPGQVTETGRGRPGLRPARPEDARPPTGSGGVALPPRPLPGALGPASADHWSRERWARRGWRGLGLGALYGHDIRGLPVTSSPTPPPPGTMN